MPNYTIPLNRFPPHLRQVAIDERDYHQLWMAATRSEGLPGVAKVEGKWMVDPDYTREIAIAMKMTLKPTKAPRRAKAVA